MNTPTSNASTDELRRMITEMQSRGLRLADDGIGSPGRRGGAGPSDHKAVTVGGRTVMIPVYSSSTGRSPFAAEVPGPDGTGALLRDGTEVGRIAFPRPPRFYALQTFDGVPYWKIAQLHAADVLATTVLQTCVRYGRRDTACGFCAIGESLASGRTVNRKTPEQLAEVARAAVLLDGVKHMVMTTGTPNFTDRGAAILCESAFAVKAAVDLPIQAQCEPPDDPAWFDRLKAAGVDALGMHLEAVSQEVRARIMPGKATIGVDRYFEAFGQAVSVFGRGQVSTYILAGLGDTAEAILSTCDRLVEIGVYPFVVPFVPIGGTPLARHPSPDPAFMRAILEPLGRRVSSARLRSSDIKAGCGRCGSCSTLSAYED